VLIIFIVIGRIDVYVVVAVEKWFHFYVNEFILNRLGSTVYVILFLRVD